jgi:hypothetical protein
MAWEEPFVEGLELALFGFMIDWGEGKSFAARGQMPAGGSGGSEQDANMMASNPILLCGLNC